VQSKVETKWAVTLGTSFTVVKATDERHAKLRALALVDKAHVVHPSFSGGEEEIVLKLNGRKETEEEYLNLITARKATASNIETWEQLTMLSYPV